jgi:hypothetical protein
MILPFLETCPMRRAMIIFLAMLLAAGGAAAQGRPKAQVLVVGTYHFHNPGADHAQFNVLDVLAPAKQREIAQVVDGLARFRPTKVLVEWRPDQVDSMNATYARYRAGNFELSRNEVHQLSYRLAARMGHQRLYAVDYSKGMPTDSMLAYARAHQPALAARFDSVIVDVVGMLDRMQRENTVGEILRLWNSEDVLTRALGLYLEMAAVGAGDTYIGARVAADWYDRNLHIFANILRVVEPGDRILFVVGQGHAPLINHFVRQHPGLELVDPLAFLP